MCLHSLSSGMGFGMYCIVVCLVVHLSTPDLSRAAYTLLSKMSFRGYFTISLQWGTCDVISGVPMTVISRVPMFKPVTTISLADFILVLLFITSLASGDVRN